MPKRWVKILSSFFYIGYAPWMPGTLGSLAGLFIFWLCPFKSQVPVLLIFSGIGFYLCRPAVEAFASKDPKAFVTDEVCGMMLGVLWLPKSFFLFLAAFILFRLFDALKPWPISKIDEGEHPSLILWDDLAAGAFTNIVLRIFVKLSAVR